MRASSHAAALVAALLLLACVSPASAKTVTVQWTIPLAKSSISVCKGDKVQFSYAGGFHNIWSMRSAACNSGIKKLHPAGVGTSTGTFTATMGTVGTFRYSCLISGHCPTMNLQVKVTNCAGK